MKTDYSKLRRMFGFLQLLTFSLFFINPKQRKILNIDRKNIQVLVNSKLKRNINVKTIFW